MEPGRRERKCTSGKTEEKWPVLVLLTEEFRLEENAEALTTYMREQRKGKHL